MNTQLLSVTRRTERLINRLDELEQIHKAIYEAPSGSCQIIFLYGRGGMGKSRLAEEVLWRGGNVTVRESRGLIQTDVDWSQAEPKAVFADLIDMTDTRLHARDDFMRALRDALVGQGEWVDFHRYDAAHERYRRQRQRQGDYASVQQAAQLAEQEFLNDYRENAEKHRLVITLDTTEKLAPLTSSWLLTQALIRPEDLEFYMIQWLADQIQNGKFPNTTFLLAGRKEEGRPFFETIRDAAKGAPLTQLSTIELPPFSAEDASDYLTALVQDWQTYVAEDPSNRILKDLKWIVSQPERVKVLWLYTGGQPVRLALYTDLILEGIEIPTPLRDDWEQAVQRVRTDDPVINATGELHRAQWEIEGEFVTLLFTKRGLRSEILQALVRAPRGLSRDQIYFALFRPEKLEPELWEKDAKSLDSLRLIQSELESLRVLAIVKMRSDGRFGLQDEIYRIYAGHLSQDQDNLGDEVTARQMLYGRLHQWADYQRKKKTEEREEFQREDERRLSFTNPSRALAVEFPSLFEEQEEYRASVREEVHEWELERLHYALLMDLRDINDAYFDLAEEFWRANDEAAEAMVQAELHQVLYDEFASKFVPLSPWPALERKHKEAIDVLRRVARQDEGGRWIKRFVLRKQYHRALEFAEALERTIAAIEDEVERTAWLHTFSRSEREGWIAYTRILLGQETAQAIDALQQIIEELSVLATHRQTELAFPERNEEGFIGHPAETRLHRVIAMLTTFIGYGYTTQGRIQKAMEYYRQALQYMRRTEFSAQHATTRNNLSRVLSDFGRIHARQVCLDALKLRRQLGAEVPIALSMNTLALIDNDFSRPDLAWVEAATAMAYFRRAEDPRGLGLALIQLAEALRRLAVAERTGWTLPTPPEALYSEAESSLQQAINLFKDDGAAGGEVVRWIEAEIEMGCLQRDWILIAEPHKKERRYRDAMNALQRAANKAVEIRNHRLQLDAQVNLAWVHYYYNKIELAESVLKQAEQSIPPDAFITIQSHPAPERDDTYVYQQLSKMSGLRGRIALDCFNQQVEQEKDKGWESRDERQRRVSANVTAQQYFQDGAEQYVLAIAYAALFSPRSSVLNVAYDSLYEYLKKFNETELRQYREYQQAAEAKYNLKNLKFENVADTGQFLQECFG